MGEVGGGGASQISPKKTHSSHSRAHTISHDWGKKKKCTNKQTKKKASMATTAATTLEKRRLREEMKMKGGGGGGGGSHRGEDDEGTHGWLNPSLETPSSRQGAHTFPSFCL